MSVRPRITAISVIVRQINCAITKALSRLGRDYIMTGYYSEIFFPSKDVRYIAIADGFDSLNASNEIAPFKNILNDMYARDISRKVKNAKRQRARNGCLIASHAPYGYVKDDDRKKLKRSIQLRKGSAGESGREVFGRGSKMQSGFSPC